MAGSPQSNGPKPARQFLTATSAAFVCVQVTGFSSLEQADGALTGVAFDSQLEASSQLALAGAEIGSAFDSEQQPEAFAGAETG